VSDRLKRDDDGCIVDDNGIPVVSRWLVSAIEAEAVNDWLASAEREQELAGLLRQSVSDPAGESWLLALIPELNDLRPKPLSEGMAGIVTRAILKEWRALRGQTDGR
jgi:hypothetical protein